MDYIKELHTLGFVTTGTDYNSNPILEYRPVGEVYSIITVDFDKNQHTHISYMENLHSRRPNTNEAEFGTGYIDWVTHHIECATALHKQARNFARMVEETYAGDVWTIRVKITDEGVEVRVGVMEDGEFFSIQRYSVSVYDNSVRICAISGRHGIGRNLWQELTTDVRDVVTEWLHTPHRKSLGFSRKIEREHEGKKYDVYTHHSAGSWLPLYRDTKSVKVIRAKLVSKFEVDEFDLLRETSVETVEYVYVAFESTTSRNETENKDDC